MAAQSALPSTLIRLILSKTGSGLEQLFKRAGSVHVLLCADQIVAQLNIETGPYCKIDDPKLMLKISETDAFLGYLYTWPSFRRLGAAKHLIVATEHDLASRGVRRIITHVRATNVPSLAAFSRVGWRYDGALLSSCSGRFFTALGIEKLKLKVSAQVKEKFE